MGEVRTWGLGGAWGGFFCGMLGVGDLYLRMRAGT